MAKSKGPRIMSQEQVRQFIKDNGIETVEGIQNALKGCAFSTQENCVRDADLIL